METRCSDNVRTLWRKDGDNDVSTNPGSGISSDRRPYRIRSDGPDSSADHPIRGPDTARSSEEATPRSIHSTPYPLAAVSGPAQQVKHEFELSRLDPYQDRYALLRRGLAIFVGSYQECKDRWKALLGTDIARDTQDKALNRAIRK